MADALAGIPPNVLAAALHEVEGGEFDLSTEEGARQAAALVERLMQDSDSLDRLLRALERHNSKAVEQAPLPSSFGAVAMEADALPAATTAWHEPPVGSAEFDAFLSESSPDAVEQADVVAGAVQPSPPSVLGFEEASVEPVPAAAYKEFDAFLLEVQRQLKHRARKEVQREGFWARLHSIFSASPRSDLPWRYATKAISNYTTVAARQGNSTKVQLQSIASGKVLFVLIHVNGTIRLKDRITLADRSRAVQRFTEVLAGDAEVGAEAVHELRDANAILRSSAQISGV
ncbi:hypothetical protein [Piscinibacter gummiphilus]|uniref:Uncharacterized protein n=1 Tax=Piscinibacter gummiphilus TaxID=946333 RepID=A0A1W6LC97_9BURK|nr:hypothetical protein [Piscinibacter gummiphilus]ARN21872.1 hypothetical protein A4W93_19300 [Piscinibacter gummiphilus]ATU66558.1 hypothetical protein CPZ87_19395 [Piscinibacter gummiphilus]